MSCGKIIKVLLSENNPENYCMQKLNRTPLDNICFFIQKSKVDLLQRRQI
jgi:hypothetical protein